MNEEQILQKLAQSFRKKRKLLKLSQQRLAKKANVALNTIKALEKGDTITFTSLIALYRAIGEQQRIEQLIIEQVESPQNTYLKESGKKLSDLERLSTWEKLDNE